jgi:large subunit ribosomal protein L5
METYVPSLRKKYQEEVIAKLQTKFGYKSPMQVPRLLKIVVNQGIGDAVSDKRLVENAVNQLTSIAGQKAVTTYSTKDISNFKLRKNMPIGVKVTLRGNRMFEFLERLVCVALPRVRDFKGVNEKFDGRGNYTLGIKEHIIFPEINLDKIDRIVGMDITFVTSALSNEEGYELLKEFGIPFKNIKH